LWYHAQVLIWSCEWCLREGKRGHFHILNLAVSFGHLTKTHTLPLAIPRCHRIELRRSLHPEAPGFKFWLLNLLCSYFLSFLCDIILMKVSRNTIQVSYRVLVLLLSCPRILLYHILFCLYICVNNFFLASLFFFFYNFTEKFLMNAKKIYHILLYNKCVELFSIFKWLFF
jgi:hypothetical protein